MKRVINFLVYYALTLLIIIGAGTVLHLIGANDTDILVALVSFHCWWVASDFASDDDKWVKK